MRAKPVLVTASFERGRGSGHLARCGLLVRDLRTLGREALLYLPGLGYERTLDEAKAILAQSLENPGDIPIIQDESELNREWAFVVFDRFVTPPSEFERFAAGSATIGIDEGGPERARFDFLLDLLPGLPSRAPPNTFNPSLLHLPVRRAAGKTEWNGTLKILVSFGGEAAARLGLAAARACAVPGRSEVTLVGGALKSAPADCGSTAFTFKPSVKNLQNELARYDLVITHFGLTVFEALYAGVPVLLLSPGRLHETLARNAGLVSAGRGVRSAVRLTRLLFTAGKKRLNTAFLKKLAGRCAAAAQKYKLDGEQTETLAAHINSLRPITSGVCPLCQSAKTVVVERFTSRTYRRCRRCGTLYMNRSVPPGVRYTEAYFFENYSKQYGKTYLEDFPNLTAMARRRLAIIKTMAAGCGGRLLDIGCAYGAFAAAARGEGFDCVGIDGSAEAAGYARGELCITAFEGFFPDDALTCRLREHVRHKFDVITLWYVIEHFGIDGDIKKALGTINSLLNAGGILAFSTPNSRGVSGRISPRNFLKNSPADHWTIWNVHSAKKILPLFGFAVKKIVVTGHHPERFPLCSRLKPGGFMYGLVMTLSRLFRLGDTFELYAKKVRS